MIDIKSQIIKPALDLEDLKVVASAEGWKLTDLRSLHFFLRRNFKYRRKITITEQSGNDLTDYQVLIELDRSNFNFEHTQTNGEDIRFTDADGNLLDYWIEKFDPVAEEVKIWVKVPSIPANSEIEIYMYYGNPTVASASDTDATFIFFDDFSTDKGWVYIDPSETYRDEIHKYLFFEGHRDDDERAYIQLPNIVSGDFLMEFDYENTTHGEDGHGARERILVGDQNDKTGNFIAMTNYRWDGVASPSPNMRLSVCQEGTVSDGEKYGSSEGIVYHVKIGRLGSTAFIEIWNEEQTDLLFQDEMSAPLTDFNYIVVANRDDGAGAQYYLSGWVDNLRIRKYASPEPSVSLGAEETA
ncbi:MAG: hypothetical protein DRN00_02390 [Thermoplasmata archaeon]|nr:MAG: hypothetical protein DRN00_02390 [Thermoplasmata archaeon]